MQYGMIGYYVPHSLYPPGYHCDPSQPLPFASVASQKNHMAIYLMCIYGDPGHEAWFRDAWGKTGKKLDMGKSCVRFRTLDDLPLDVVGSAIKRVPVRKFIERYEQVLSSSGKAGKAGGATKTASITKRVGAKKRAAAKTVRQPAAKPPKKEAAKAKRKA